MIWIWSLLGCVAALLFIYIGVFSLIFVRGREQDLVGKDFPKGSTWAKFKEEICFGAAWVEQNTFEPITITSRDGVRLYGRLFPAESRKIIVLFHGYRSAANRDFSCALEYYHKQGFQILLVDQRAHGKSGGRLITFGMKERYDCKAWLDYLNNRFGGNCALYLSGISMGSATVLMALGLELPPTLCGVIADCGFTSPADIISAVGKKSHVPPVLFLHPVNLLCRLFGHFSIYGASTVSALRENTVPVLFIHGTEDRLVPSAMSETNFAACKGPKKLVLVEKADHGLSFLVDRETVEKAVTAFLADPAAACKQK